MRLNQLIEKLTTISERTSNPEVAFGFYGDTYFVKEVTSIEMADRSLDKLDMVFIDLILEDNSNDL